MINKCHCGKVSVKVDSEQAVISCQDCGWHYTYKAVPKNLVAAIEELVKWFKQRGRISDKDGQC